MKYLAIIAVLLAAATVHAEPTPPHPVQVENGIASFGWANDPKADTVVVLLERDDCRSPGLYRIDPNEIQQPIWIPPGPPYDEKCLIRPYDRIMLLLYRDDVYVGQLGPYIPRPRVYLPVVRVGW